MGNKLKGISLVVLVITILVVIILATAVIISIVNNNPINTANEAVFKSDLTSFQNELEVYKTNQYASNLGGYNSDTLQANLTYVEENGQVDTTRTILNILPSLGTKYKNKVEIVNGKLVFIGSADIEKEWAGNVGVEVRYVEPQINIGAPSSSTVTNQIDVDYEIEFSSNYALNNINLENKIELVKISGQSVGTSHIQVGTLSGDNSSLTRKFTVTVNTEGLDYGEYKIVVLENTVTNSVNSTNTKKQESMTFTLNEIVPTAPNIVPNTTEYTNQNVIVTITYDENSTEKKYSIDGGDTWLNYTAPIVVTQNMTIVAKGINDNGTESEWSSLTIDRIDKIAPTIKVTDNGTTSSSVSIKIVSTDEGGSGINTSSYQYSKDNGTTWTTATSATTYSFTGLTSGTYECKAKVKDKAGNETISSKVSMATQGVGIISIVPNITAPTNQNVIVTINYPSSLSTKEYKIGSGSWTAYTTSLTIAENTTITAKGNDIAGNQAAQANSAITNIDKVAPSISNVYAGGILYGDQTFKNGLNGTSVYNNNGNGVVTNTRVSMPSSPTGSGYAMEIRTTNSTSIPGWGGFYFSTQSYANKIYVTKIIAKIPVGYNIQFGSNTIGDGGYVSWLTSQEGTGDWKEYICKLTCGPTGSFSTTNFYYLTGGNTPTPSSPLIWYVAYATVFDLTAWNTLNAILVNATDNTGIVGYGVNQSSSAAPTFTNCSANTNILTVIDNINTNGINYVWVKDQAGNVSNSSIYINNGLVGKFSFDNSILNEVKNKSYTGTGTSFVQGKIGNGLKIVGGQVSIPLTDLDIGSNTNAVAVSFWFKWNGEYAVMPIGFYGYDAWITDGCFGYNTGVGDVYGINNPFSAGVFTHVALTFNKGNYGLNSIYINGVKQTLTQKVATQNTSNATFLQALNISGWLGDTGYKLNGSVVDEIRIFNRALTDAEVVQLMNN